MWASTVRGSAIAVTRGDRTLNQSTSRRTTEIHSLLLLQVKPFQLTVSDFLQRCYCVIVFSESAAEDSSAITRKQFAVRRDGFTASEINEIQKI